MKIPCFLHRAANTSGWDMGMRTLMINFSKVSTNTNESIAKISPHIDHSIQHKASSIYSYFYSAILQLFEFLNFSNFWIWHVVFRCSKNFFVRNFEQHFCSILAVLQFAVKQSGAFNSQVLWHGKGSVS